MSKEHEVAARLDVAHCLERFRNLRGDDHVGALFRDGGPDRRTAQPQLRLDEPATLGHPLGRIKVDRNTFAKRRLGNEFAYGQDALAADADQVNIIRDRCLMFRVP